MKKTFGSIAAALALTFAGAVAAPSEAEARENCNFRFGNNGFSVNCNVGGNRGGFNSNGGFFGGHGGHNNHRYDPRREWEQRERQCQRMAEQYERARERLYFQGRDGFSHDERRQLQRMQDNMARRGCYIR